MQQAATNRKNLRDQFNSDSTFAAVDPETLPAGWCRGVLDVLPTHFPFAFRSEGAVRYFLAQQDKVEPYLKANALRKQGREWIVHLRRFAAVWADIND